MKDFPHHYTVAAKALPDDPVELSSPGLPTLESAPPVEFGGPGDRWSPETLLVAAVADCFVLSFKAIAQASKFEWTSLSCDVEGELDRQDKAMQFVGFRVRAVLDVPAGADESRAQRLLEKAEHSCLITSSLKAPATLEAEVRVAG
ncbi:MAG TPA: OsmC family protein [Woeseiaceae bacterium]|nr:OsmC family protein [Woeseiaceae bacterium]